ncbi:MAG: TIGR00341 family protein, partial [Salinigranum sp.]
LSIVLGAVTWTTFQTVALDQQVQGDLQRAFDEASVPGVELVSVTVDYKPVDVLLGNEPRVDVLVGIPRDLRAPPDLAQRFDDRLTEQLGRDVRVRVGFVEAQVSRAEAPKPPLGWPSFSQGAPARTTTTAPSG